MCRAFPALLGPRHVTVCEPEIGGAPDTGYLTFLDTTDPAKPAYISSWVLPGNLTGDGLRFSPHYFDVSADGRVALASYHAGVWVIDASRVERPASVAFAETSGTGAAGIGPFATGEGSAFDAWWLDGRVVVGDATGGLAVYRLTEAPHAP